MQPLRFRQVHLDFHTSGAIEGIGEEFRKEEFQEALREGHVDSITVFSKCHHGWAYHPTQVHEMHPGLKFDLLKAQLEACREIGVKAPVYISAGLDEKEAVRHPEWLSRQIDETTTWVNGFNEVPGYHLMCFNTGYMELLLEQIKEVMENYQPEGIFLDISAVHPCYCAKCRQEILDRGKEPRDLEAVMEQAELVYDRYGKRVRELIHSYNPECTIFHNAGHITRGRRDIAAHDTHLELESLPTGGWGYDHFPMSASYVCNLGMEYLGMTGKFHSTWGEFGGFKHPNALRYEAALSIAFGAKCSIGDQLHPAGRMNPDTYRLIGKAYAEVEKKEPWCIGAVNQADVGILGDQAINCRVSAHEEQCYPDTGANRIMLEGKYLYRFIDLECRFEDYKVLVLPDSILITAALKERLEAYLEQGGRILATGRSGLNEEMTEFALDFGAEYLGKNEYRPNYIVPEFPFQTGRTPHIMYGNSYDIRITDGECLAKNKAPYFNRDVYRFSSHQHTPDGLKEGNDAVVIKGNTAYIGWDIFTDYAKMGSLHLKECVVHVLDKLLGADKTISVSLPDRGVTTLTYQEKEHRYINHLLFAHTTTRGIFEFMGNKTPIEIIEDIVPLYQTEVKLRIKEQAKRVYLAPAMEEVPFKQSGQEVSFCVERMECHQMVVVEV